MKTALIIDTETSGVDATSGVIEVACILYDLEHAGAEQSFASLIYHKDNPAEHINHISVELLQQAPPAELVWSIVGSLAGCAEVVIAHNAEFDRRFVPGYAVSRDGAPLPWSCSMGDIRWPYRAGSNSLVSIALAHGLGVASSHRALTDCDLISRLLTRVASTGTSLPALIDASLVPKAKYKSLLPYEGRQIAKEAGFQWDGERKMWWRRLTLEEARELPFDVVEV